MTNANPGTIMAITMVLGVIALLCIWASILSLVVGELT